MYYFKRNWDETTGEEMTDSWGFSLFYFETDGEGRVLRQMQLFEGGQVLKYDPGYPDDKYGGISEYLFDPEEFKEYLVDKDIFETKSRETAETAY